MPELDLERLFAEMGQREKADKLERYRRLNALGPEAFQSEHNLPFVGLHIAQMNGQADCGNARESFRHNGFLPVSSP